MRQKRVKVADNLEYSIERIIYGTMTAENILIQREGVISSGGKFDLVASLGNILIPIEIKTVFNQKAISRFKRQLDAYSINNGIIVTPTAIPEALKESAKNQSIYIIDSIRSEVELLDKLSAALMKPVMTITPFLTWEPNPKAESYDLQISIDPTFASFTHQINASQNYYPVSPPLDPDTQYYWRFRSVSKSGPSPWVVRVFKTTNT